MGIFFSTWKNRTLQVDQICRKFWKLLHFLTEFSITSADSLQLYALQPVWLLSSWNSPGKNTGVGCHFLLQGILPTQRANPGILHCRQILYHLSHREAQQRVHGVLIQLELFTQEIIQDYQWVGNKNKNIVLGSPPSHFSILTYCQLLGIWSCISFSDLNEILNYTKSEIILQRDLQCIPRPQGHYPHTN